MTKKRTYQAEKKAQAEAIKRCLKSADAYDEGKDMQIWVLAGLRAFRLLLEREIGKESFEVVTEEISREGNSRITLNPICDLYKAYLEKEQIAIRALGMNADSRMPHSKEKNGASDFLSRLGAPPK